MYQPGLRGAENQTQPPIRCNPFQAEGVGFDQLLKGPLLPQKVRNHGIRGSSLAHLEENSDSSCLGAGLAVFAHPLCRGSGLSWAIPHSPSCQLERRQVVGRVPLPGAVPKPHLAYRPLCPCLQPQTLCTDNTLPYCQSQHRGGPGSCWQL